MGYYTADIETEYFKNGRFPKFIIGCVYDGNKDYKFFYNAFEMWQYMQTLKGTIYFHNGGKFDFYYFRDFFDEQELLIVVNRIVKIRCGRAILQDSFALIPVPLKDYKKDDFNYYLLDINKIKKDKSIIYTIKKYLKNDCFYLYGLLKGFKDQKIKAVTLASASLKKANTILKTPIKKTKTWNFDIIFRPHYRGGRVQVFYKGFHYNLYIYDLASSYPFSYSRPHPFAKKFEIVKSNKIPNDYQLCLFHFTEIKTSFDCLPLKLEDNKLHFLRSAKDYFLYGYELEAIIKSGILISYKLDYYYKFFGTIDLTEYANYFFNIKNNSIKGSADYISAKLFLNSIYGAFALNPENFKRYYIVTRNNVKIYLNKKKEGVHIYNVKEFSKKLFLADRKLEQKEKSYINVVTASSITAHARGTLLKYLVKYKNNLAYCDTDSIFLTKPIKDHKNGGIGSLHYEGNYSGHILDRKLYHLTSRQNKNEIKTASKGAKLTGEQWQELIKKGYISVPIQAPILSWKQSNVYGISKTFGKTDKKRKHNVNIVHSFT